MDSMSHAIVLAAGLSRRMQTFKPLLPFGGTTIIENTVVRLQEGGVEDMVVVTGFLAPEVERTLAHTSVRFIHNADFSHSQMLDSVKLGLSAMPLEDVFLLPADLPQFSPLLLAKLLETKGSAAYPVCNGQNGHPLLLRGNAIQTVLQYDGAMGLKGALHTLQTQQVFTKDCGCLLDADTPEDYQALLVFRGNTVPTEGECTRLFHQYQTPLRVQTHCEAVRKVALRLAQEIPGIDVTLLETAARIHDAARSCHDHAWVLSSRLRELGYLHLAEIVRVHMDLPYEMSGEITESSLLYLADKLVVEDREVSLQERFEQAERRFANDPEAMQAIRRRKAITQRLMLQVEELHQTA